MRNRWCGNIDTSCTVQLLGFFDASQLAFAACVYARVQHDDGAVLLARLLSECRQALRWNDVQVFAVAGEEESDRADGGDVRDGQPLLVVDDAVAHNSLLQTRNSLPHHRREERARQAVEIDDARRCWIRLVHHHEFGEAGTSGWAREHGLDELRRFVDVLGLLRGGGRLQNANLAYKEAHPPFFRQRMGGSCVPSSILSHSLARIRTCTVTTGPILLSKTGRCAHNVRSNHSKRKLHSHSLNSHSYAYIH